MYAIVLKGPLHFFLIVIGAGNNDFVEMVVCALIVASATGCAAVAVGRLAQCRKNYHFDAAKVGSTKQVADFSMQFRSGTGLA